MLSNRKGRRGGVREIVYLPYEGLSPWQVASASPTLIFLNIRFHSFSISSATLDTLQCLHFPFEFWNPKPGCVL